MNLINGSRKKKREKENDDRTSVSINMTQIEQSYILNSSDKETTKAMIQPKRQITNKCDDNKKKKKGNNNNNKKRAKKYNKICL